MTRIQFNRPFVAGREIEYLQAVFANRHFSGDGPFTKQCHEWLERNTGAAKALLTHSCTAALEMAALLVNIQPGDEVILPSYTFVSTANAFVLRGGVPVFVDIRSDTLNLDERLLEAAITPQTRAIVPVHYAGVACEMDAICTLASRHGLAVVEDAAQGLGSAYRGRPLGSIGSLGTLSFHETKNVIAGEGGALLVNDPSLVQRAEIIREKGTDRSRFFRGEVDKYTWQEVGSSYLPSDLVAAFLWAQLESAAEIMASRLKAWNRYQDGLAALEADGLLRRPLVPGHTSHNAHIYYVLLQDPTVRQRVIGELKAMGIHPVFHYVPLHSSPAGRHYGRISGTLAVTDRVAESLLRLPLWAGLGDDAIDQVVEGLTTVLRRA